MKRISLATAMFCYIVVAFSSVLSQTSHTQNTTIYTYQNVYKNHPDGVVGKLSFSVGSSYLSIKNQPGLPVTDAQKYSANLGFIISDKFSEHQSFTIIKEFQSTYEIAVGFKYYLANPLTQSAQVNPDGKIGAPVLSVDAIMLLDNFEETKLKTNYRSELTLPLATSYSIFAGYTAYEEITNIDVEKFFGGVHIYLASYTPNTKFENPDSPLSGIALSLSGGSSDFGSFGKIELCMPSSFSTTIKVSARGDFLEAPRDKIYTGSISLIYYSGK